LENAMTVEFRPMTIEDYPTAYALWEKAEGVGLSSADQHEAIASYLARNPGISQAAFDDAQMVGVMLCGHDGRRGLIHHLVVADSHRRQGVGRQLVERGLAALAQAGIQKCHIFVFTENHKAIAFWQEIGWEHRQDLMIMSSYT
jgi:putative acetyltransferase